MKELISKLTCVDYIALVALLRGLYVGYRSGFFHELLRVASYLVTIVVTISRPSICYQLYIVIDTQTKLCNNTHKRTHVYSIKNCIIWRHWQRDELRREPGWLSV